LQPKAERVKAVEPAAAKDGAVKNVSSSLPAPTIFKAMGYVEKAGGQLEAIILQENQVQVVHVGDLIAGRYRVTKVSPDSVEAIDETLVQSPMAKPNGAKSNELTASAAQPSPTPPVAAASAPPQGQPAARETDKVANGQSAEPASAAAVMAPAEPISSLRPAAEKRSVSPQRDAPVEKSLGYVQKADGKVEAVLADGDSVRLVPVAAGVALAQVAAPPPALAEASPAQVPAPPVEPVAATASSTGEVMAASARHSEGSSALPLPSEDWQASYEVSSPAPVRADGSAAAGSLAMGRDGGTAEAEDGTIDPSTPRFGEKRDLTVSAIAAHEQHARATRPVGSTVRLAKLPVEIKPLGFVKLANGELAAILSQDDEVYVVRQGDRFADRYRAVRVSADAVEAVEEPPRGALPSSVAAPPPARDIQSASITSPASPTFVFQTLGYVETQGGGTQAIVAEGSQLYLVKQGETFADQYRATSVDRTLVLATRVPPGQEVGNPLSARTESGGQPASKKSYGGWHNSLSGWANAQALHEVDASGGPGLTNLGVNLLNSSLTGFDLQLQLHTADNPNVAF
jgi:Tfp pilus assembly protein PilP